MTNQMRGCWWVLLLVHLSVGCIGAELNDNGDTGELGVEEDPGVGADRTTREGRDAVEIRDGALDLRDQARSQVAVAPGPVSLDSVAQPELEVPPATDNALAGDLSREDALPKLSGKAMEIISVSLQEVEQGFQLSILCSDMTVDDHFYDYRLGTRRSERCEMDLTSARASLEFEPSLAYQLVSTPQGTLVSADFERRDYKLKVKAGLRTREGGALKEAYESSFTVGRLSPTLEFVTKGRYMPRAGWQQVSLRHRNVQTAELEVWHVPGRNMAFWMSGYRDTVNLRSGDLAYAQQLQMDDTVDQQFSTELPLRKLLGEPKPGLYELRLKAGRESDTLHVIVTDLQVIAKRSDEALGEQVDVWAVHAQTLKPLAGATVEAIYESGTVVGSCQTNASGYCRVHAEAVVDAKTAKAARKTPRRTPFALVVTHKDDATFLKYAGLQTKLARGKTHGSPYKSQTAYKAYAYGDRDLYRPADVVYMAAMVRDNDLKSVGPGVPVDLVVVDSRAQIVNRETVETNAGGMVSLDHRLSDLATTGRWKIRVEIGKREVTSFAFGVEEFMPERLKVEAAAQREHLGANEAFKVDVHARYLFGASAVGSNVSIQCERTEAVFQPSKHAEFHYGIRTAEELGYQGNRDEHRVVSGQQTKINADDMAHPECDFRAGLAATSRLRAQVGVSESGSGRTTHASASAWAHPADFYLGVRADKKEIQNGESVTLDGVVVDWDGELIDDVKTVDVSVLQLRRRWGWWRQRNRHQSQWFQVVEKSQTIPVRDGKFTYKFSPNSNRYDYAIRLQSGDARTDLKLNQVGYWRYYSTRSRGSKSKNPSALTLQTQDEMLGVNALHKVRFEAEYKGRALMTLETDEVLQSAWIDVAPGEVEWSFKVGEFAPNVYVSAMLIKDPHADSATSYLPERAYGALSIPMKRDKFIQNIQISAPESVRPGRPLQVDLDLGEDAAGRFVTVAAVDQGILSLTDYQSPNPLAALLARRALGVRTYDTIGWALQLAKLNSTSKTGGDGEEDTPTLGRIMPFKPVALWSGIREVPESGKLSVAFDVPLYQGELRVMAVTTSKTRIGQADTRVKVRAPIVVQATLPRFLVAGDQVDVPVFLTNTTADTQVVETTISAEALPEPGLVANPNPADIIGIEGNRTQQATLDPGASKMLLFKARALRSGSAATFAVVSVATAKSGEILESRAEGIVPFRAAGPLERKVKRLLVSTKSLDLTPILEGWEPSSEKTTFRLSTNPHSQAFDHLSALVRYPYGCLEQTISQLRPMIYLSELVRAVDPGLVAGKNGIRPMIESGVRRILSMQTPSGGFGFWSGDGEPHAWATPYAIYLLMDAQKRGYSVPQQRLDRALNWLESDVKRQQKEGYGASKYYRDRYISGFAYYVLALANRANQGQIRKIIDAMPAHTQGEQLENLYLLKAALYLSGDRSFEKDLKAFKLDKAGAREVNYGSYYSTRRRDALLLNVFVDLFGPHENGFETAERLGRTFSKTQTTGYLYSTQEMGWGLTALGKWYRADADSTFSANLMANGRAVKTSLRDADSKNTNWAMVRASEYDSLTLELDETPQSQLYLVVSSEGVRSEPSVEFGGAGLSVSREYLNEAGEELDGKVQLGDLVYVRVRLKSKVSRTLENIALVDRLPAGLEIENPNLGHDIRPHWASSHNPWQTDHMNVRDDRLEAFGTIHGAQTVELVYATRATLTGKFHAPSIEAEGMYDPEIWARAAYRELTIAHDWDAMID
ncbi:alpha-2-macroglobulin family protein [Bradymonas sediminis]|uniref:Uncharacterized protein n=1 Tax=Bradymonas sediminis TaxID=1548548 RepID=A0A2Z4FMI8_9DELT|nr:MG2 domain-containing protein [Bradymonas sediminis]AWV90050.1 hypothetical protein DN745_12155 [Bradymonas sediminis]TDP75990.1 hypothetical protein DFR33_103339 [Bradymonas sediminis]